MIKARVLPRGASFSLGVVYPKVAFIPENLAVSLLIKDVQALSVLDPSYTYILDPNTSGWGITDHQIYGQSGDAAFLFDWANFAEEPNTTVAPTTTNAPTTTSTPVPTGSGWRTFTGTAGNGDNLYTDEVSSYEVIDISSLGSVYPYPTYGIVTTSEGAVFVGSSSYSFVDTGGEAS